jgi:hypothetical protein
MVRFTRSAAWAGSASSSVTPTTARIQSLGTSRTLSTLKLTRRRVSSASSAAADVQSPAAHKKAVPQIAAAAALVFRMLRPPSK